MGVLWTHSLIFSSAPFWTHYKFSESFQLAVYSNFLCNCGWNYLGYLLNSAWEIVFLRTDILAQHKNSAANKNLRTWTKFRQVIFHNGSLVTSSTIPSRILICVDFITTIITVYIPTSIVVFRDCTGITLTWSQQGKGFHVACFHNHRLQPSGTVTPIVPASVAEVGLLRDYPFRRALSSNIDHPHSRIRGAITPRVEFE
jgi:hypothetical protein